MIIDDIIVIVDREYTAHCQLSVFFFFLTFLITHTTHNSHHKSWAYTAERGRRRGAGEWPEDQKRHRGRTRPPPLSGGSSPWVNPEGPTQGTHTEGTHTGDPHRGCTRTRDPQTHTEGRAPQRTHHRRGGPHRGPTTHTEHTQTANTPFIFIVQYIARYAILRSYLLLHSPAQFQLQFWSVCWRCSEEFLVFLIIIYDYHIIKKLSLELYIRIRVGFRRCRGV